MKRVISDTDGGHLTDRPQGRRNRRGRRAIAAFPDFGQNRSKTFTFKMPWISTCPPPQIFIPYNGPEGTLQPIGTRGQNIWPKYNQNLHLSISLCPLRFVDLPSALSYRQDHSCSRIHWMFPQTRKREDDSKSVTTLPPHKIHPQRCDIRHWYDFIGQVTETRQKLDWKNLGNWLLQHLTNFECEVHSFYRKRNCFWKIREIILNIQKWIYFWRILAICNLGLCAHIALVKIH